MRVADQRIDPIGATAIRHDRGIRMERDIQVQCGHRDDVGLRAEQLQRLRGGHMRIHGERQLTVRIQGNRESAG